MVMGSDLIKKKILIVGAKGFIGSNLLSQLSIENVELYGTSRKGSDDFFRLDLEKDSRNKYDRDINHNWNYVIYCVNILTGNIDHFYRLKAFLQDFSGVFILLSSVDVNGMVGKLLPNHMINPSPITDYGIQKLKEEFFVRKNFSSYKILRLFPVYSPNEKTDILKRVYISKFFKLKLRLLPSLSYRFVEIKTLIAAVKEIVVSDDCTNSINYIYDPSPYDQNILCEKNEGRSIPVPVFLIKILIWVLSKLPSARIKLLSLNLSKLVNPVRLSDSDCYSTIV